MQLVWIISQSYIEGTFYYGPWFSSVTPPPLYCSVDNSVIPSHLLLRKFYCLNVGFLDRSNFMFLFSFLVETGCIRGGMVVDLSPIFKLFVLSKTIPGYSFKCSNPTTNVILFSPSSNFYGTCGFWTLLIFSYSSLRTHYFSFQISESIFSL